MSITSDSSQRGALSKGCLIGGAVVVLLLGVLGMGGCAVKGKYNSLVALQEGVKKHWSEIDNQYKRRFDMIPQLVETVKGSANFEKSTLDAVIEARASVGRVQLPADMPTDAAAVQAYIQAQNNLGGALGRLFAVAEAYPDLKASAGFLSLQDQIEGTENRIAVARRDYLDAAQGYNTARRQFPGNLVASLFSFDAAADLPVEEAARDAPKIEFDFDK